MVITLKRCSSDPIVYIQLFVYKKNEKDLHSEKTWKETILMSIYQNIISQTFIMMVAGSVKWLMKKFQKSQCTFLYSHFFINKVLKISWDNRIFISIENSNRTKTHLKRCSKILGNCQLILRGVVFFSHGNIFARGWVRCEFVRKSMWLCEFIFIRLCNTIVFIKSHFFDLFFFFAFFCNSLFYH